MKILGIETSCDETAAAVVEDGTKILSNVVASSAEMHVKTGGVSPEVAARQQIRSILPVVTEAIKGNEVDAIAVTTGPGLIGSLLVGVETAKSLAFLWKKPIVPVNHLVAHIYANWLAGKPPSFPALALVVSGGHTDLVLIKNHGKITWIGGTRDDAAGEAFDKSARLLGLPYPGGPSIAAAAEKLKERDIRLVRLPRPMNEEKNFDWSFSGLKTAVLREAEKNSLSKERLAAEVQEAIVDVLVEKTLRAVAKFRPKSLLLAGGVSANLRLRERFTSEVESKKIKVELRFPPFALSTDNASYVASFAFFNYSPTAWENLSVNPEAAIV